MIKVHADYISKKIDTARKMHLKTLVMTGIVESELKHWLASSA